MSFTVHRVYNLQAGVDYNPSTNGNSAIKFRGYIEQANPTTIKVVSFSGKVNPFTRYSTITGTPVIIGPGWFGREPLAGGGDPLFTTTNNVNAGIADGTYDFYLFDEEVPSSLDSPVLAFHVVAQASPAATPADDVSFVTLSGNAVTVPGGGLALGGIYDYGISEVTLLPGTTALLGLAPANKPLII
jgi:hypothetical protein